MSWDTIVIAKGENIHNTGFNMSWGSNCIPERAEEPCYGVDDEFNGDAIVVGRGGFGELIVFVPSKGEVWSYPEGCEEPWDHAVLTEEDEALCGIGEKIHRVRQLFRDGRTPTYRELGEVVG